MKELCLKCVSGLKEGLQSLFKIDCRLRGIIYPCCVLLSRKIHNKLDTRNVIQDRCYPYMNAHFNVSVETSIFHTEEDITYTLIYYPQQVDSKNIKKFMSFQFYINNDKILKFHICQGLCMIYSEMMLTHRQSLSGQTSEIMNLSAYTNKRLFQCTRMSLKKGYKVCFFIIFDFYCLYYSLIPFYFYFRLLGSLLS